MVRILMPLGFVVIAAMLEGLFAGTRVKQRFAELKFPWYSLPLPAWYIVGILYYSVCFVVLFRLLGSDARESGWYVSFILILILMFANAGWNYFFFRSRNLLSSFVTSGIYSLIAVALLLCLIMIDRVSALVLFPYILYLGYANMWGYQVWKLNQ